MLSRTAFRSTRAIRANAPAVRRHVRFQSTNASQSTTTATAQNPAIVGAAAGAGAAGILFYILYSASGLSTASKTMREAKSYYDKATNTLKSTFKDVTPEPNEAINVLRETADKYAKWLPGGREYVDKVFKDLEMIRNRHGEEVDNIVREAYGELRDVSKKGGLNLQTLTETWEVMQKHLQRLGELASDAAHDILNNHPELKDRLGGSFDQLKQLGDQLGPEAKKQVDETWKEVSDILKSGVSYESADRVRKLVQDKQQQVRKLGEQAWDKGFEQARPMLEKSPQVKQLVENNVDVLKSGNATEALSRIQSAVTSGNTLDLEKYVINAKEKAQQSFSSGQLSDWLNMLPQGSKILPQLQKLKQVADSQGQEAQQLAKDTLSELGQVLDKRARQLEEVYKKAKQQGSK